MAKRDKNWERFRVLQRLGAGAFGRTLLVADASKNDRQVVIKVPHDKNTEKALINDLVNAAALTASLVGLAHPNIVRFLGFDTFEGYYVMIMEYVKGEDLRKKIGPPNIASRRPMDNERALRYFGNACAGLVEAHRINLLHRDIKPDNIIVREEDDIAKLLDFGISTVLQSASVNAGTVAGTFPYMAPEALSGRSCLQSDLWSMSVTLYELLTGTLPFWDENLFELKRKIDHNDPAPPRTLNPDVDSRISDLTMRGLQKDPKERFQSAEEMLSAFFPVDAEIEALRRMFNNGQDAEAEAKARELLRKCSSEVGLYLLIGEFHNRQQQYAQAEEILRKGIAIFPEHPGLRFYLAPALFSQGSGRKREAVEEMERAVRLGLSGPQRVQAERVLKSWSRK